MANSDAFRLLPPKLTNRAHIMRQLQNVVVYRAEKVVVIWKFVTEDEKSVESDADTGRVKLAATAQTLEVYLTARDSQPACPPLELHEEISNFCGLTDPNHIAMLQYILMSTSNEDIEDLLQRRGVPNVIPEFDQHDCSTWLFFWRSTL